jgi:hypothetical protein
LIRPMAPKPARILPPMDMRSNVKASRPEGTGRSLPSQNTKRGACTAMSRGGGKVVGRGEAGGEVRNGGGREGVGEGEGFAGVRARLLRRCAAELGKPGRLAREAEP